jgi:hypothetical protein
VSAARVIEAIDVFEDGNLSGPAGLARMPPDQLRLDGLEEGFDGRVIIVFTFPAHGFLEAMLAQQLLIFMRAILAAPVRVMNAALGWSAQCDGHVQRPDRQIALHPITDCPADHASGIQAKNHGQIEPAFARLHIADINHPFLIGPICREVPVQQVWRDIEVVIAVRRDPIFLGPDDGYAVLAHQSPYATVPDIQAKLFQLFGHSRPEEPSPHVGAGRRVDCARPGSHEG